MIWLFERLVFRINNCFQYNFIAGNMTYDKNLDRSLNYSQCPAPLCPPPQANPFPQNLPSN